MKKHHIAIIGANQFIAKEFIAGVEKSKLCNCILHLFDSQKEVGVVYSIEQNHFLVQDIKTINIKQIEVAILFDHRIITKKLWQELQTIYVINLCQFQQNEKIILPYLNLEQLKYPIQQFYIPKASILLVLHIVNVIKKICVPFHIVINTVQGIGELEEDDQKDLQLQLASYQGNHVMDSTRFPLPKAKHHMPLLFQVFPQTSPFLANGMTQEEQQIIDAVDSFVEHELHCSCTAMRIASFRGLAASISIQSATKISLSQVEDAFSMYPMCRFMNDINAEIYPTFSDMIHDHHIAIGRIRSGHNNNLDLWSVCDEHSIRCRNSLLLLYHIIEKLEEA